MLTAIDKDVLDIEPIKWRKLLPFVNKLNKEDEETIEALGGFEKELGEALHDYEKVKEKLKK